MQQITHKKTPQLKFAVIIATAVSVVLVFTVTPWNIIPTQVTEDVTVIAVTDFGCVAESVLGQSVVIDNCQKGVEDVISASFYVPAMEQNGYYDRVNDRLQAITP